MATGNFTYPASYKGGSKVLRAVWEIPTPVFEMESLQFGPGDTTLNWQPGATVLILIPPDNVIGTVIVKGNAGDDGVDISGYAPTILTNSGGGSVIINNGAGAVSQFWTVIWL